VASKKLKVDSRPCSHVGTIAAPKNELLLSATAIPYPWHTQSLLQPPYWNGGVCCSLDNYRLPVTCVNTNGCQVFDKGEICSSLMQCEHNLTGKRIDRRLSHLGAIQFFLLALNLLGCFLQDFVQNFIWLDPFRRCFEIEDHSMANRWQKHLPDVIEAHIVSAVE